MTTRAAARRLGTWAVTGELGSGSHGTVYAAHDPAGSQVALKVLRVGTARAEATALGAMSHRNVIRCLGVERIGQLDVLVLERAGVSLQDLLRDNAVIARPSAARYVEEVCSALAHVHASGWVHGDVKPGNILLAHRGHTLLSDFGLAAPLIDGIAYSSPAGSPDHVPPERRSARLTSEGFPTRTTADIWALGVLAHQLFTGDLPFRGRTPAGRAAAAISYARGRTELTITARIPPGWRRFIADCLAPDHQSRAEHTAASLQRRARMLNRTHRAVPLEHQVRCREAVRA